MAFYDRQSGTRLPPGARMPAAFIMVPMVEGWNASYENPSIRTNAERARHFGQSDHVRVYGRDLRDPIAAAGLTLTAFTASAQDCLDHGIQRGEKIFIAGKPN